MPRDLRLERHLGKVVATRRLKDIANNKNVIVRIGVPRRSRGAWDCPFAITGSGIAVLAKSTGGDSMQALLLAFMGIRRKLDEHGSRLTWLVDLPPGEYLGFPRILPDYGREFEKQVSELVVREGPAWAERIRRSIRSKEHG